eukprot:10925649-Alexandrium_andersonii.AAC.1
MPGGRAVLLIDQGRAFEGLSPAWVRAVLAWRQTPAWLVDLAMAFMAARRATFALPSGKLVSEEWVHHRMSCSVHTSGSYSE